MAKSCAIVELENHHDEVLPSLSQFLEECSFHVDFFVTEIVADRGMLRLCGIEDDRIAPAPSVQRGNTLPAKFMRQYQKRVLRPRESRRMINRLNKNYDLVVIASADRFLGSAVIDELRVPHILVVHNPRNFIRSKPGRGFFDRPGRSIMTLSQHGAQYLQRAKVSTTFFWPVVLPIVENVNTANKKNMRFGVQGKIDFLRRNYSSLVTAFKQLRQDKTSVPYEACIVGRPNKETATFRDYLNDHELTDVVKLIEDAASFEAFYSTVRTFDYLLPLVDNSEVFLGPYLVDKATSSVPTAIGSGIPLIISQELAELYGVSECGYTYTENGLRDAVQKALHTTPAEYEIIRQKTEQRRNEMIRQSRENFVMTVKNLFET